MRRPFTKEELTDKEPALTAFARQWNDVNARAKGLTGDARLEALKSFGRGLKHQAPVAVAEPRLWAATILTRIADGEVLPPIAEKYAREVLEGGHADL